MGMRAWMLVYIKCMFLTENIAIVLSYLMNQEPCQGIVLQLDVVLVVERDTMSFHDKNLCKKWIRAVKQQRSKWGGPTTNSLLCLKHFEQSALFLKALATKMLWVFQQRSILSLNLMQGGCSSSVE